jgi:hypothetical protein
MAAKRTKKTTPTTAAAASKKSPAAVAPKSHAERVADAMRTGNPDLVAKVRAEIAG